jgi:hypothetical protein
MYNEPIQVKQSERVGRGVVDAFETAIARSGKSVGYIVAFSFTRGAYEEAASAKAAGRATIVLVKVADLLSKEPQTRPTAPEPPPVSPDQLALIEDPARRQMQTPDLMRLLAPEGKQELRELPLPLPRQRDAKPSPDELVESDRSLND